MTSMGPKSLVMKDLPPPFLWLFSYPKQTVRLPVTYFNFANSAHTLGCDFMDSPILSSLG